MSGLASHLLPLYEENQACGGNLEEASESLSHEELFPKVLNQMAKSCAITLEIGSKLGAAIDFEGGVLLGTESSEVLVFTQYGVRVSLGAHQAVTTVDARRNVGVSGGVDGTLKVWNLALQSL